MELSGVELSSMPVKEIGEKVTFVRLEIDRLIDNVQPKLRGEEVER